MHRWKMPGMQLMFNFLMLFLHTQTCSIHLYPPSAKNSYLNPAPISTSPVMTSEQWCASGGSHTSRLSDFKSLVLGGGDGKHGAFLGRSNTLVPPSGRPQATWQTTFSGHRLGSKHPIRFSEGWQRKKTGLLPGCRVRQVLRRLREAGKSRLAERMSRHNAFYPGGANFKLQVFC